MQKWQAKPVLEQPVADGEMTPVINPAEPKDIVGWGREATESEVEQALQNAVNQAPVWFATPLQRTRRYFAAGGGIDGRPNAAVDWPSGENVQQRHCRSARSGRLPPCRVKCVTISITKRIAR